MSDHPARKILVVEKDGKAAEAVCRAIPSDVAAVEVAATGEEALKRDEADAFDLIIADASSAGAGGLDLLRAVKARRPDGAFILISGSATIKAAVEAMRLGALDYLAKPVRAAELRAAVSRVLEPATGLACAGPSAPQPPAEQRRVPAGFYCVLGHTWLKVDGATRGTVGVVHDFFRTVGPIVQVELPKVGEEVSQGVACGRVVDSAHVVHPIFSPATGRVTEVNLALASDASLVGRDPYGHGYLFRIQPTRLESDLKGLVRAK